MKDFKDNDEIEEVYYKEVISLLKDLTGAVEVFPFDHTLRGSELS